MLKNKFLNCSQIVGWHFQQVQLTPLYNYLVKHEYKKMGKQHSDECQVFSQNCVTESGAYINFFFFLDDGLYE